MAAETSDFVSCPVTVTWGGNALGDSEGGYRIIPTNHIQKISVDRLGDSVVQGIRRGRSTTIEVVLTNPSAQARRLTTVGFYDEAVSTSTGYGTVSGVGKTLLSIAAPLVLTPISGVNTNSKTRTYPLVVPDEDSGGFSYNSKLQTITCRFMALVDLTTGVEFTEA